MRWNETLDTYEGYDGNVLGVKLVEVLQVLVAIKFLFLNEQTVTTNYTIPRRYECHQLWPDYN